MAFKCPKCNYEYYDRLSYCPECGFDFTAVTKRCPRCRKQIPVDSKICPECKLNFEQYSFLVPRVVVLGSLGLVIFLVVCFPWIWKTFPLVHDKGATIQGKVVSEVDQQARIPLFVKWQTGERYIEVGAERSGYGGSTDYMNNLIPLPPSVVFHYDMPIGERVWIIHRVKGSDGNVWLEVGRWITKGKPDKYGWVHASDVQVVKE